MGVVLRFESYFVKLPLNAKVLIKIRSYTIVGTVVAGLVMVVAVTNMCKAVKHKLEYLNTVV